MTRPTRWAVAKRTCLGIASPSVGCRSPRLSSGMHHFIPARAAGRSAEVRPASVAGAAQATRAARKTTAMALASAKGQYRLMLGTAAPMERLACLDGGIIST